MNVSNKTGPLLIPSLEQLVVQRVRAKRHLVSPLLAILAALLIMNTSAYGQLPVGGFLGEDPAEEEIEEQVEEAVEEEVEEQIEEEVVEVIEDGVEDSVEGVVEDSVEQATEQNIQENIEDSIEETIEQTVDATIENNVDDAVASVVEETVEERVEESVARSVEDAAQETAEAMIAQDVAENIRNGFAALLEEEVEENVSDTVEESIKSAVEDGLEASVEDSVAANVESTVEESIGEAVEDSLTDSVDDAVASTIEGAVEDSVSLAVESSVESSVESAVNDSLEDTLTETVEESVADSVEATVADAIDTQITEDVSDTVSESVEDAVAETIQDTLESSVESSVVASTEQAVATAVEESVAANVEAGVEDSVESAVTEQLEDSVAESVADAVEGSVAASVEDAIEQTTETVVADSVEAQVEERVADAVADRLDNEIDEILDAVESDLEIDESRIIKEQWLVMADPAVFDELSSEGYLFDMVTELPGLGLRLAEVAAPSTFDILDVRDGVIDVVGKNRAEVDLNHIYTAGAPLSVTGQGLLPTEAIDVPIDLADMELRVGMIDSEVDTNHPALKNSQIEKRSFARSGSNMPDFHGTAIASIIAANSDEYKGLAPSAKLFAASVFELDKHQGEIASTVSLIRAIDWLISVEVDVVNVSLAGPPNRLLERALDRAAQKDVVVMAAAGNGGPIARPMYPAAYDSVVAVTAVDSTQRVFRLANRGEYLAISAPGVDLRHAEAGGGYAASSGTSFAVPFAVTAAARLSKLRPKAEIIPLLLESALDIGPPGRDSIYGYGLLTLSSL
ncbi:MAG: S8 family serine peptidase [Pseudomonadota bacterium]